MWKSNCKFAKHDAYFFNKEEIDNKRAFGVFRKFRDAQGKLVACLDSRTYNPPLALTGWSIETGAFNQGKTTK